MLSETYCREVATIVEGYILRGMDDEYLLVVRTPDPEVVRGISRKIQKMRDPLLKELGKGLEEQLDE